MRNLKYTLDDFLNEMWEALNTMSMDDWWILFDAKRKLIVNDSL